MERTQVPKFGNWGSEEVPYTMYFDNARKGKKSGQIYQDNVEANTLTHSEEESEVRRSTESSQKGPNPPEVVKPCHDRRSSREEGEMRRLYDSPLRHEAGARRASSNSSPHHRSSAGDTPKKLARHSVGSDRSMDHSPLHPQGPKGGGKSTGISSPSWERKGAASDGGTHGLAPSTPGRSRLRSVTRGDESPDRGPAVPKFGEWDETDPAAAEGYTQVFNKVREEKHSETGKVPPLMPTESLSHSTPHKHYANDNAKGCGCFLWGKR